MRNGRVDNPPCYYQMQDCAANYGGVCLALQSTRFKRGYCPFYRSRSGVQRKASEKAGRKDEAPEEKKMKNKLYLVAAIANFIVCGAYISMGQHVLAPFWSVAGGIWLYLWSRKD